jgi:hypothetical protein
MATATVLPCRMRLTDKECSIAKVKPTDLGATWLHQAEGKEP